MDTHRVGISVIVPAYREAENLPKLMEETAAALGSTQWPWEVILVDDNSPDATPAVLRSLAGEYRQFRYLVRHNEKGLSSAVLAGFALARFGILVVMDADLSHPPGAIPDLVRPLLDDRADFVIGSRYVQGGGTQDGWGLFRQLNSAVATLLSRPFAGRVRDPMAGFLALRRSTYLQARELSPIGYKIGLELIVKCSARQVVEVPIFFRNRLHGKSKLTVQEQFRYLEHLSRLYDYRFPRGSPRAKFLIAAICGALAGYGIGGLTLKLGVGLMPAAAIGLAGMLGVIMLFFARYARTQRQWIQSRHPWEEFFIICGIEMTAGLWTARWAYGRYPWWMVFGLAMGACVVVRYIMRKIFGHDVRGLRRDGPGMPEVKMPPPRTALPGDGCEGTARGH